MKFVPDVVDEKKSVFKISFSKLYSDYYVLLCTIAFKYLKDRQIAEDAVGEVFLNFWEKCEDIEISTSAKAYLVRSVKNWCLNYIQHQKVERRVMEKIEFESSLSGIAESDDYPLGVLYESDLASLIYNAIASLPEQCRKIFLLSRDEDLSYEKISERLNISVNTVKTQIRIALSKLRELLKGYVPVFLINILYSLIFI